MVRAPIVLSNVAGRGCPNGRSAAISANSGLEA
jgi:hypothetical protein